MKHIALVCSFVLVSAAALRAGIEPTLTTTPQSGTVFFNTASAPISHAMSLFSTSTGLGSGFTLKSVSNLVKLWSDPNSTTYIPFDYELRVPVQIAYWKTGNPVPVKVIVNETLSIQYFPDPKVPGKREYRQADAFTFRDGCQVEVKVNGAVTATKPSANNAALSLAELALVAQTVFVHSEITVERYFNFDPAKPLCPTDFTPALVVDASSNELKINWNPIVGAEEYDLEWIFVDDYGTGNYASFVQPANLRYDFDQNAARVQVKANAYRIPLVYERGWLLFRVRGIGRSAADQFKAPVPGVWSCGSTTATCPPGTGTVCNTARGFVQNYMPRFQIGTTGTGLVFEGDKMNWQAVTTFAEEGKRKSVVSFVDGSNRVRQSVTVLSSERMALVGEQIYDHQGRAAISVLPVPVNNATLKFYPNFNQNQSGAPYSRTDFDLDPLNCQATTGPMRSDNTVAPPNTGAANYYSPLNPVKTGFNAYIPDAENFPFTQIEFMPDNTGRVRRQSGVGKAHLLGSGHETEYFYGTPVQEELDRLFGNEVGNSLHYKKHMVRDANGQHSITWLDPKGNTVATALGGEVPKNLDKLPSYQTVRFDVDLLAANVKDETNYALTTVRTLLVSTAGSYDFTYTMTGQQFQDLTCMDAAVCYDCIYDLELAVIDNLNCNDTIFHHTATIGKLMEQISGQEALSTNCASPAFGFNSTTDLPPANPPTHPAFNNIPLTVGSYTVIKRLKVNEAAADAYVEHFLNDPTNKCSGRFDDYLKTELSKIDTFGCHIGCGDIDTSILNDPSLTPAERQELRDEIAELQEAVCDTTLSLCETAYAAMRSDVSPGGQYGHIPGTPSSYPQDDALSVFSAANVLPTGSISAPAFYQNGSLIFRDENGAPFKVFNPNGVLVPINDASINLATFLYYWRDEWAAELVKFHPEYCYYQFCVNYLQQGVTIPPVGGKTYSSEDYDTDMAGTFVFNTAVQKGFIDLSNPFAIVSKDPFFQGAVPGASASAMINRMTTFVTVGTQSLSMKQMAMAIANCPNNPTAPCYNAAMNTGKSDLAWTAYRALYTSVKQEMLYKIRSQYAIANGCYNGCIGEDPFQWQLNNFSTSFWPFPFGNNTSQYCDIYTFPYFYNKAKRFPSVHDILPPDFTLDFYNPKPSENVLGTIHQIYNSRPNDMCCDMERHVPEFLFQLLSKLQPPATNVSVQVQAGDPAYPSDVLNTLLHGFPSTVVTISLNPQTSEYIINFGTGCDMTFILRKGTNVSIKNICCFKIDPNTPTLFSMVVTLTDGTVHTVTGKMNIECRFICPVQEPECPLTQDAKELGTVFSYLMGNGMLVGSLPIPGNLVGPYLAGALGEQFDLSWQGTLSGTTINGKILNLSGATLCTFSLQKPSGVSMGSLNQSQCIGIRPNTAILTANGHTKSFFLKIKLSTGATVDMSGTSSCLSISFCCKFFTTKFEKALWGINTQEDVLKNCQNCNPLTVTGGIFGWPEPWTSSCFTNCDSIKHYNIPVQDSCVQNLLNLAHFNAGQLYGYYLDSLKAAVRDAYMWHCLQAAETFTVKYEEVQHHYTLYYYDQANNLVKTVPPAGVVPLVGAQILQVAINRRGGNANSLVPAHTLTSRYRYNSLNQLVWQKIPDHKLEGLFFYDGLGRLVASINGKQRLLGSGYSMSYTRYDALGRIVEVGQTRQPLTGSTYAAFLVSLRTKALDYKTWDAYVNAGVRTEITRTEYDRTTNAYTALFPGSKQENLRGRVVSVTWQPNTAPAAGTTSQLWYSYDIHGNVKTMVQKSFLLDAKTVEYEYDLVSGKVNNLAYQRNKADQFLHRYAYDADNRLTEVRTSPDGIFWDKDAAYRYYKHGPLARTELGDSRVQGLDYAYTLHGWIKGMNSGSLNSNRDMGGDGQTATAGNFARDAVGYTLGYYDGDYKAIGGTNVKFEPAYMGSNLNAAALAPSLFNGNIRHMMTAIEPFMVRQKPLATCYRYDQLNRLLRVVPDTNFIPATNQWIAGAADQRWTNSFSYDANGNILTQKRNGDLNSSTATPKVLLMDDLKYNYYPNTNQLRQVTEPLVPSNNYAGDIDHQTTVNNYVYDAIGNLTNDAAEGLRIEWNLQGKVSKITDALPAQTIDFGYNPMGNRVLKTVGGVSTYHALDASGNVLATYRRSANGNVVLESAWLYGRAEKCVAGPCLPPIGNRIDHVYRIAGKRRYEESNHLGNVMAVVSDRKMPVVAGSTVTGFAADVVGAQDYYAFGMMMVGRTTTSGAGRFGFNGKENVDEVEGKGNFQDYGARVYFTMLGRFISPDIREKDYPWQSTFAFSGNNPIALNDINGEGVPLEEPSTLNEEQKNEKFGDPKTGKGIVFNFNVIGMGKIGQTKTLYYNQPVNHHTTGVGGNITLFGKTYKNIPYKFDEPASMIKMSKEFALTGKLSVRASIFDLHLKPNQLNSGLYLGNGYTQIGFGSEIVFKPMKWVNFESGLFVGGMFSDPEFRSNAQPSKSYVQYSNLTPFLPHAYQLTGFGLTLTGGVSANFTNRNALTIGFFVHGDMSRKLRASDGTFERLNTISSGLTFGIS
ncbi:MAG: DUF6443 domain-containing protein, partial [Saprospiraceae bacterium]